MIMILVPIVDNDPIGSSDGPLRIAFVNGALVRRKPRMGGAFWFVMLPASLLAHSGSFKWWCYPEMVSGLAANVTWKVKL